MATRIIVNTSRTGYSPSQVQRTIAVGELRGILDRFEDDAKIYLSFDNRYTYGGITLGDFSEEYVEDGDEE